MTIANRIRAADMRGLLLEIPEFKNARRIVVSNEEHKRVVAGPGSSQIEIYPWREFLAELWDEKISELI